MNRRSQLAFLVLVCFQALHSIEEYSTGLYNVLAPARFVSGLVSNDVPLGFAIINAGLVGFGLWCYLMPIRRGYRGALALAWTWAAVELLNGVGHIALAISVGGYFPGILTAPLLLIGGGSLATFLSKDRSVTVAARSAGKVG